MDIRVGKLGANVAIASPDVLPPGRRPRRSSDTQRRSPAVKDVNVAVREARNIAISGPEGIRSRRALRNTSTATLGRGEVGECPVLSANR